MGKFLGSPWFTSCLLVMAFASLGTAALFGVYHTQIAVDAGGQPLQSTRAWETCGRCGHRNPYDDHGILFRYCRKCGQDLYVISGSDSEE